MPFVKEQLTTEYLLLSFIYTVGAVSVVLIVLALGFIDTGLVRRKNVLDTWVQKLLSSVIAGGGTLICGVGIWNAQFNQAFGVPDPFWQAIKDWWVGGKFLTHYAGALDPKILPEAEVQQVFAAFFITFSLGTLALIHTGAMERMKARPLYTMAFVIGLVLSPLVAYLNWGPVGPLSNHGTHDFDGIFPLYIFAGTWVLVLSWRLGPRLGAFTKHVSGTVPASQNVGLVGAGVLLIMFALPFVALSSTFIIPEVGVFGISMTQSGWGIILENIFAAYIGGAITGGIIAYRLRQPLWALLGPLSGAVMCGTLFDVGMPWEVFLVSLAGPPVALGTTVLMRKLRIDEPKVIPLALGPGIAGALVCGFVEWGTKTGGYPGLEGNFALGHATITPWWQLAGVVSTMAIAAIPCLLICLFFEKTSGLRVTEAEELVGLDKTNWDVDNFGLDPIEATGNGATVRSTEGTPVVTSGD
ncbi:MAG: ammonium transporter [Solirubrobacterales bacterium]|jgi:Amt family ammonium transporter|nr:ammonium transporter [Solirubrobacterales bacterium]